MGTVVYADTGHSFLAKQFNVVDHDSELADRVDRTIIALEHLECALEEQLVEHTSLDKPSLDIIVVALEHLGAGDINVNDTLSLERLSEKLSTFAEAAKQLLKKIWMATKTFMADVFKYGSSLTMRADAISDYSTKKPNDKEVPIKLLFATKLEVNGKVPSKKDLLALYARACPSFEDVSVVINSQIVIIADMIDDLLDGKKTEVSKTLYLVNQRFANVKAALDNTLPFQRARVDLKEVSVSGVKGKHTMPTLVIDSKGMDDRGTDSSPYTLDSLSSSEVQTVTKALKTSVAALSKAKKQYSRGYLDSKINRLAEREAITLKGKDKRAINIGTASKIISKSIRMLLKFNNKYIMYMMGIHKAMLDYCAQSIKAK